MGCQRHNSLGGGVMTVASIRPAPLGVLALMCLAVSTIAMAQTQQAYRYVDPEGRVVYSDKPPPPDARDAQAKRNGRHTIQTNRLSFAAASGQEHHPPPPYNVVRGTLGDAP